MAKKEKNVLSKILAGINKLVNITKEHKNISKKSYKNSMSKKEQRIWNGLTIIIMLVGVIGIGAIVAINFAGEDTNQLKIELIKPSEVILNDKNGIDFEIRFTNIGKTNLSNFDILKIDLYRMEAGELNFKQGIIRDNKDYSISCRDGRIEYGVNLPIGGSCTVKTDMLACPTCFDDKDKEVFLLIYFNSVPPIKNRQIKIPIY